MQTLTRVIQSYQVILGGVVTLGLVWAANEYLLKSTAEATGWPVLIGITLLIVTLIVWVRQWGTSPERTSSESPFPWNSR